MKSEVEVPVVEIREDDVRWKLEALAADYDARARRFLVNALDNPAEQAVLSKAPPRITLSDLAKTGIFAKLTDFAGAGSGERLTWSEFRDARITPRRERAEELWMRDEAWYNMKMASWQAQYRREQAKMEAAIAAKRAEIAEETAEEAAADGSADGAGAAMTLLEAVQILGIVKKPTLQELTEVHLHCVCDCVVMHSFLLFSIVEARVHEGAERSREGRFVLLGWQGSGGGGCGPGGH